MPHTSSYLLIVISLILISFISSSISFSQVFKFCRPKCHKAFVKKRNPRKVKWTKAFRRTANKEMKVDSTFEFEKRRNVPVKYDRDLVGATLQAMSRVGQVQAAREARYFKKRMGGKKKAEKLAAQLEVARGIDLVAPAVARKGKESNIAALAAKVRESAKGAAAARRAAGGGDMEG